MSEALIATIRAHAVKVLAILDKQNQDGPSTSQHKTESEDESVKWGGAEFWEDEQWKAAVEELFYNNGDQNCEGSRSQQDDMVFFVLGNLAKGLDVTVRRKTSKIPEDVQPRWMESLYLNVLMHTVYTLTVAICSKEALDKHRRGEAKAAVPLFKTSREVYASHMHTSVNLSESKAGVDPQLSYPEICFTIDDFEGAFEDVIVDNHDHCLCVLLYARDGPTFQWRGGKQNSPKKISLFSGYVPFGQLQKAVQQQSRGNLSGFLGYQTDQKEKLFMRGPGGRGHAEVAVTSLVTENRKDKNEAEKVETSSSKGNKGFKGFLNLAAANAASVASNTVAPWLRNSDKNTPQLRCCLMNVSLPWQTIIYDILKASK